MKKLFLTMILAVTALCASSQIVDDIDYPTFHFGIRGGGAVSNSMLGSSLTEGKAFVTGGLAFDFQLGRTLPLYLETGVYYFCDYKWWSKTSDNHSIKVPLMASYHLYLTDEMNVQLSCGPFAAYGVGNESFDGGIRVGCAWSWKRLWVGCGYDIGVVNHSYVETQNVGTARKPKYSTTKYEGRTGSVYFTVGFNFCGSY